MKKLCEIQAEGLQKASREVSRKTCTGSNHQQEIKPMSAVSLSVPAEQKNVNPQKRGYAERLKDPRWQKRRLKVMEYAHWRCQICGCKEKTLHCHHSYYLKGKQPWQYP